MLPYRWNTSFSPQMTFQYQVGVWVIKQQARLEELLRSSIVMPARLSQSYSLMPLYAVWLHTMFQRMA